MSNSKHLSSLGIVEPCTFTIQEEIELDCGQHFAPIEIRYETYGTLNKEKDNGILVLHALTGDAHAAGVYSENDKKPGWWDQMIGPGKPIDTNKYFVICSNVLGGCKGTTGPASIDPKTNKPYGLTFPMITIHDMVKAQYHLIKSFGIEKLLSVIGGSMGGMQALQWSVSYPEMVSCCIPIATTGIISPQSIAFNEVGRQAIIADPHFNNGDYFEKQLPEKGLSIARMIGHITYLSDEVMHEKFGRRLQSNEELSYDFLTEFQVESYLHYQGRRFVERFDADSYLYMTKAMDYYDLSYENESVDNAFTNTKSRFLIISFSSDWLFPPYQSEQIVQSLCRMKIPVSYYKIESHYGHDAFLIEFEKQGLLLRNFLEATAEATGVQS